MAWPQYGTAKAGAVKDDPLAHSFAGAIAVATNRLQQVADETANLPVPLVWFASQQQAEAYAKQHYPLAFANWKASQGRSVPSQFVHNLGATPANPTGSFTTAFFQANIWLRVAEVVLGLVLIAVGVARLTGTQNAVSQIVKARIP